MLAHEDDVKIARWREQYDKITEDTKDPGLLRAKKAMKKKCPRRRENEQVLEREAQFQKIVAAPPGKLYSRGRCRGGCWATCWTPRLEIDIIRRLVGKRLMDAGYLESAQRDLERMLLVLHKAGYVKLEPEPPEAGSEEQGAGTREGKNRESNWLSALRVALARWLFAARSSWLPAPRSKLPARPAALPTRSSRIPPSTSLNPHAPLS